MLRSWLVAIALCFITSMPSATAGADAPSQTSTSAPKEIKTLAVPGAALQYIERGHGPVIVLVHGSLGELSDWDPDATILASRGRVIAYSRRFHEPNAPPRIGQPYSMRQHAEDLAALIRANGGRADVVAHSYGAYTSLYMAIHHHGMVRTLVLAEPPILPWLKESSQGQVSLKAFQDAALMPAREAFLRGDMQGGMRAFINGVSGRAVFDQLPAEVRAGMMRAAPELRAELTTNPDLYMPSISCSQVQRFNHPVLIVTSEKSPPFFHIIADRLRACLPHAEVMTIKGVGHGGMIAPPAFTQAVNDFLSRHRSHASAN